MLIKEKLPYSISQLLVLQCFVKRNFALIFQVVLKCEKTNKGIRWIFLHMHCGLVLEPLI